MLAPVLRLSFALLLVLAIAPSGSAAQYPVRTATGGKVVHTRVAPVLIHRLLPPFHGRHVYQGRAR
jgi:hypothetical protein